MRLQAYDCYYESDLNPTHCEAELPSESQLADWRKILGDNDINSLTVLWNKVKWFDGDEEMTVDCTILVVYPNDCWFEGIHDQSRMQSEGL